MKLTVGKHVATVYFNYDILFTLPEPRDITICIIEYNGKWGKGVAIRHPKDNDSIDVGRKVAFGYALKDLVPKLFSSSCWVRYETLSTVRSAFWDAYFKWKSEHEPIM